jgi:hypothetical protein
MILYVGNPHSPKVLARLTAVRHFCFDPRDKADLPDRECKVLLDSGAFRDVRKGRVSFAEALDRQLAWEQRNQHVAERLVSYDMLIDEQLIGDRQVKHRWAEADGWEAVRTTIDAAAFLAERRGVLRPRQLVLACQGVTAEQYITCVREVLQIAEPDDCIGLGGWCIVGQRRQFSALFWRVMRVILPLIATKCADVHIFGLTSVPIIRQFALECQRLGLRASTDTTRFYFELSRGYVFSPTHGKSFYEHKQRGRNLARDHRLAVASIQSAYEFFQRIEEWTPPQGELFG